MTLWAKVQSLGGDSCQTLHSIYGDHFPIEVRHVLAEWIEEKFLGNAADLDLSNHAHRQYIVTLVSQLIIFLEERAQALKNDCDNYVIRIQLSSAAYSFRERFIKDPLEIYKTLRNCLACEMKLVSDMVPGNLTFKVLKADDDCKVKVELNQIRKQTELTANIVAHLENEKETFTFKFHDRESMEETQANEPIAIINAKKKELEDELNQRKEEIIYLTTDFQEKITASIKDLTVLVKLVLDVELTQWKQAQLGVKSDSEANRNGVKLTTLQCWCESLTDLIWISRQQLKDVERLIHYTPIIQKFYPTWGNRLPILLQQVNSLLSTLVKSTFVIETQPSQVLKTQSRFESDPCVRLLVGGQLNLQMNPPTVTVNIISESQALSVVENVSGRTFETSGNIVNNTTVMEYDKERRCLFARFRNIKVDRIKRGDKVKAETVTDEKFCLFFNCKFTIGEKELVFNIWAMSLPVVVIVNVSQESRAWGTVTWDNAFAEPGRLPFQVPQQVPWSQVARALSDKFESATGRGLTNENLKFLGEKAFSNADFDPNDLLTWTRFCKDPLPRCEFTFWDWFFAILKLTRDHLKGPWAEGLIIGFIERRAAEMILTTCHCGTFLIRFSDSKLGAVSLSCANQAYENQQMNIWSVDPYTSKDLATRSLANQIMDLPQLVTLFPGIPKDVFIKYSAAPKEVALKSKVPYLPRDFKAVIPGLIPSLGLKSPLHSPNSPTGTPHSPNSQVCPYYEGMEYNPNVSDSPSSYLESFSPEFGLYQEETGMDMTFNESRIAFDLATFCSQNFPDLSGVNAFKY